MTVTDHSSSGIETGQPKSAGHSSDQGTGFTLYKSDISYFSGKIEAYLNYKGIAHQAVDIDYFSLNTIARATGVKKVPAMVNKRGEWLFDSTPMIQYLESQFPQAPVLPDDAALKFVALLLEDYGDEWLWRPAMWWRWMPKASRLAVGQALGESLFDGKLGLRWLERLVASPVGWYFSWRQRREWLWADGMDRHNEQAIADMLDREFETLEAIFAQQPFLLGSHPSVADYGFFASMFRHFGNDPTSAEKMRREAPNTYEWTARLWNAKATKLAEQQDWTWPQASSSGWQSLFARISGDYLVYLQANAKAWLAGAKTFDVELASFNLRQTQTTDYRVYCLEQLQRGFQALNTSQQQQVLSLCSSDHQRQQMQSVLMAVPIASPLSEQPPLPYHPESQGFKQPKWQHLLMGQARN